MTFILEFLMILAIGMFPLLLAVGGGVYRSVFAQ